MKSCDEDHVNPPESHVNSVAQSPVKKEVSEKTKREKRFKNLMTKIRHKGDDWINKDVLK